MKISFSKYQGAGNDFVIIDNHDKQISLTTEQINFLCNRHFGIGADGLMLLQHSDNADFEMVYYNADGNESTMCGNGGRCIAAFAKEIGVVQDEMHFVAIDGMHQATILPDGNVALHMQDVEVISFYEDGSVIMNTGSPHYIRWVKNVNQLDVFKEGRAIRNEQRFMPKGINVNFAQKQNSFIHIRTYERGVEDETLACGTGVTSVAIASVARELGKFEIPVKAVGGDLSVSFTKDTAISAKDIVLTGPARAVFSGSIDI